jgi:hypothetical protein
MLNKYTLSVRKLEKLPQLTICYLIISLLFLTFIIALYPGQMSPDSYNFFNQSITQKYLLHSSPLLPFMWHILNYINEGPVIMLVFQQLLLWSSVAIFVNTWHQKHGNTKIIYVFIFIPLLPSIILLSGTIWKDVHFAFSYLLATSLLSRYITLKNLKPSAFTKVFIFILICYGTSVKFQASFLLPVMIMWYLYVCFSFSGISNIVLGLLIAISLNYIVMELNGKLARDSSQISRVGWQEIKFCDLIFISRAKNVAIFPEYILQDKNFNFDIIKDRPGVIYAFEFLYGKNNFPIKYTTDTNQQNQILSTWNNAISKYPFTYLYGRLVFLKKILFRKVYLESFPPHKNDLVSGPTGGNFIPKLVNNPLTLIFDKYITITNFLSSFIYCLPFLFAYITYGLFSYNANKNIYSIITLMLNSLSLTFLIIMTFYAVNNDFRYIFVSHILFHFSHPFAWQSIKEYRSLQTTAKQKGEN